MKKQDKKKRNGTLPFRFFYSPNQPLTIHS